jgi:hypothetical protein
MVLAEQTDFETTNKVLLMWTSAAYVGTAKGDDHQHAHDNYIRESRSS